MERRIVLGGRAWVNGDVLTLKSAPITLASVGEHRYKVFAFIEIEHAAFRKQNLKNWKAQDWIEHASFGLGRISESREGKLDIEFVSGGRKTILKSKVLKPAASPSQDFKFPRVRLFDRLVNTARSSQFCRRWQCAPITKLLHPL
jgi:hypothetical protein